MERNRDYLPWPHSKWRKGVAIAMTYFWKESIVSIGEDFFFFFGLQPTARLKLQYLLNTNGTLKM